MKLSIRLEAILAMIHPCNTLADVGTDHGFIPIEAVRRGLVHRALAMDINEGPLSIAAEHIRQAGLQHQITCRLCDGMDGLQAGDAELIVIAGMGGDMITEILERSTFHPDLLLSPHTHPEKVRCFLRHHDYRILREKLVEEDGKFYPMISAIPGKESSPDIPRNNHFGAFLLAERDPVLLKYCKQRYLKESRFPQQETMANLYLEAIHEMCGDL